MKQKPIRCPYCGSTAILKDASYVYGSKSKGGKVYVCSRYPECNSYVGVHPGTNIAKGTLADKFCLTAKEAHIGEFDLYMCEQLICESMKILRNNHIPLRAAS